MGRMVLRIDPADWSAYPVAAPSMERPIDVAVSADGRAVWMLDFGRFEMLGEGRVDAAPASGAVFIATLGEENVMAGPQLSFAVDIRGEFYKYQGQMMWRLDLANYEDVKANASIIMSMTTAANGPPAMPPPPFPPLSDEFIATFGQWIAQGCSP